MSRFEKIDNFSDFRRDTLTGAIVNINKRKAVGERKLIQRQNEQDQQINNLKNDVSEIKQLLHQLIENKSND